MSAWELRWRIGAGFVRPVKQHYFGSRADAKKLYKCILGFAHLEEDIASMPDKGSKFLSPKLDFPSETNCVVLT